MPHVIGWTSLGGTFGTALGVYIFQIPPPFPKILFTFVATAFGVAMVLSRWGIKWSPLRDIANWNSGHRLLFTVIGFAGGAFSANTGSGTDMLAFIVLTLAFGLDEKISTPTSVIIMGVNSLIGAFMHSAVLQAVGISWSYWLVAAPIVILGAPLGAFVVSIVKRDHLILFILLLIAIELSTTLWLIPLTPTKLTVIIVSLTICVVKCWCRDLLLLTTDFTDWPIGRRYSHRKQEIMAQLP